MSRESTPMMKQYRRIRRELPEDAILFFRLGDFYEMFFEDAREASSILDVALTKRQRVPMCGVPYHAAEGYIAKLIRAGRKVAICDQVEDPASGKGIVRREVTRIVTPGTVVDEPVLEARRNNYLAGVCRDCGLYGLALLDLSTGTFMVEESRDPEVIRGLLQRYDPAECLVAGDEADAGETVLLRDWPQSRVSAYDDYVFERETARDILRRHFAVHSLEGFGCENCSAGICAAGAVLHYVTKCLKNNATHVRRLQLTRNDDYMILDAATVRNLDLIAEGGSPGLLAVLDVTRTSMGGRMLRDWLLRPLNRLAPLQRRQAAVAALHSEPVMLEELRRQLASVKDLERLLSRLNAGGGNARDLRAVGLSLAILPDIRRLLTNASFPELRELGESLPPEPELVEELQRALVDEPPAALRDGGIIRDGYNEDLDTLRQAAVEGRQWIADMQSRERGATGIKSLKIRYNKVFGYYIEVTRANLERVPEHYRRKQTLVNAERYITAELKDIEHRLVGARERSAELEYQLFGELRRRVVECTGRLQQTAATLARIDVLAALAERARSLRYVRPGFESGEGLVIRGGRHPVIEQMPDAERFVPNDSRLDTGNNRLAIITGPNMAGKSTYIRQVALIVIMAQVGSFVPAEEVTMGLVDRVFTRVGASDDLARGRSTFMVEMQETANILNNATRRSLIVLDEIGRGTSTFDGISIAWAVAEYIHDREELRAKTLFATHYHELTDLARTMRGIRNYNVQVRESGRNIVFLRTIAPGPADKSYGIQVARLAGLPEAVLLRAREILANLEEEEFGDGGQPKVARRRRRTERKGQLDLFDKPGGD